MSRGPVRAIEWLRGLSLFWQVFLVDAVVLVAATAFLAAGPFTIHAPIRVGELAVLVGGLAAVLGITLELLRRTLRPLRRLTRTMQALDPLGSGRRVSVPETDAEVRALSAAFNDMLDRLEHERRESVRMALSVQEGERQRVARELHDEVGQTLTAVLLQIQSLSATAPAELHEELDELRETARSGAEDVRRIARRLRPEALEELGLQSALVSLAREFHEHAGIETERRIDRELPPLTREQELVIYRVAQEALTNVARHAGASRAEVTLTMAGEAVLLRVRDDGRGLDPTIESRSYGLRGMRERAMLIGATLSIDPASGGGTEVSLEIPEAV